MTDTSEAPTVQLRPAKMRAVAQLVAWARNARTHSEEQIAVIAASITEFGWTNPVLVDGNEILAGHGRVLAAVSLGLEKIPCINLGGLSDIQKRAYVVADNRIAELAGWDENLLMAELVALDDDMDLGVIGFDDFETEGEPEIDVKEIDTSPVSDQFWVSIRGPLERQPEVLQILADAMKKLPGVEVGLGTVSRDDT